jgi:hypothetical protein
MKKFISILVLSILPLCNVQSQSFTTNNRAQELQSQIASKRGLNIDNEVNELLTLYQQHYSAGSLQYADALMWVAMACAEAGDNRQGLKLLEQSDARFSQYGKGVFNGRDTIQEIFHLDLKSKLLYNSGADYRALLLAKKSLQLKKTYFCEQSEVYLNALLDLSRLYAERLKYRKSNRYHNLGYKAYVERIKQEFCSTSESERASYWEKAAKYINKTIELAHQSGSKSQRGGESSLTSAAYNALLLSKGILLNTSVSFEDYINNSGNVEAQRNLRVKKQLSEQHASQQDLDSLDYVILRALQEKGQGFQLPHLSIGWKDVEKQLHPGDLAVEFYRTTNDSYGALLLKSGWKSPKVVRLNNFVTVGRKYLPLSKAINDVSLEKYDAMHAEDLWHLSKAIWTDDIVKYFPEDGKGRVFFSADGELLITGIEYLPFVKPQANGQFYCLSDLFNMYRLSSTRELVLDKKEFNNRDVAIYGGLRYDMETDGMIADARHYQHKEVQDLAYSTRSTRYADKGLDYLEFTKEEADSVAAIINTSPYFIQTVLPYTQYKGTEASFKNLSGKQKRVIHVATHGFFYNEDDATFSRFGLGENPMVRSGLFFAGADNKWLGDSIPDGVDDGFLTSYEISNLDFRGLNLVVLSACETGRGSIKGDGVFGLQRGFKMASAQSILMSLWKVDDNSTCFFMTEFYKNWIAGKSKHDALELAKQSVRSHKEKGWDNPKHWAAFILLDALD